MRCNFALRSAFNLPCLVVGSGARRLFLAPICRCTSLIKGYRICNKNRFEFQVYSKGDYRLILNQDSVALESRTGDLAKCGRMASVRNLSPGKRQQNR